MLEIILFKSSWVWCRSVHESTQGVVLDETSFVLNYTPYFFSKYDNLRTIPLKSRLKL